MTPEAPIINTRDVLCDDADKTHTTLHDSRDDGSHERNGESVVNMIFEGPIAIEFSVVREDVQECPDELQPFPGDVGHLEYRADPVTDKVGLFTSSISQTKAT